jgi:uncharacterized membrane protein
LTGRLRRFLDRFIPRFVTGAIALGVVALLFYLAISGLLLSGFLNLMDTVYAGNNTGTDPGAVQPTTPLRSGSSASLVSWQSLGRQGRNFVGRGPTPAQLTTFSGQPALEPIRVYVGLDSADSAGTRADLAVKELERTGAFNRKILVVTGVTGTGWLEPQSVDSLEYEWNGDSAIVGIQYSYLPSWIATLVDVDRARDAGRELFNAVYLRWSQLPAGHRPKLISYGLSLGSFAAQAPFTSPDDVTTRTQGAVFAGSPGFSEPWGTVTAGREPGSPQWQPTYFGGQRFRFAAAPSDLSKLPGVWGPPRVAYLQHANDPVVWWSGRLLWQRPDWLREPAGPGRTPVMAWYPVLTFLQVTVDQFVGVSVPNGQGHNYGTAMPTAWAAVTQPPGWTSADTSRLDEIIAAYAIE